MEPATRAPWPPLKLLAPAPVVAAVAPHWLAAGRSLQGHRAAVCQRLGHQPGPHQVCLSGLAACFAVTYAAAATAEGVKLTKLQVTAENWMDLRKQMGLSKDDIIERVKFTVVAEGADRPTLERILKLAEERCPGSECVTRAIPLSTELT